jgi:hypothetical protein
MTIDNGSPPPEFLRLEPPQNGIVEVYNHSADLLVEIEEATEDPLKVVARKLRALTLEHITTMCSAMGKPDMRDTLVKWAVAYLDGTPMPEEKERRL